MDKTALYQAYYDEHSAQAKLHEEQRERITGIVLSIAGLLIGLVTFAKLAIWALAASIPIILLGLYGYLFAGKHYERFKFHTTVMRGIRQELDGLNASPHHAGKSLGRIRQAAGERHYRTFVWPTLGGSRSAAQQAATSWIARQRLHVFWEGIHLMVALMGVGLTAAIVTKKIVVDEPEARHVQVIGPVIYQAPATPAGPAKKG